MTRHKDGAASSIPQTPEHAPQRDPKRGGEAVPHELEHLRRLDYWAALNALRDERKRLEDE